MAQTIDYRKKLQEEFKNGPYARIAENITSMLAGTTPDPKVHSSDTGEIVDGGIKQVAGTGKQLGSFFSGLLFSGRSEESWAEYIPDGARATAYGVLRPFEIGVNGLNKAGDGIGATWTKMWGAGYTESERTEIAYKTLKLIQEDDRLAAENDTGIPDAVLASISPESRETTYWVMDWVWAAIGALGGLVNMGAELIGFSAPFDLSTNASMQGNVTQAAQTRAERAEQAEEQSQSPEQLVARFKRLTPQIAAITFMDEETGKMTTVGTRAAGEMTGVSQDGKLTKTPLLLDKAGRDQKAAGAIDTSIRRTTGLGPLKPDESTALTSVMTGYGTVATGMSLIPNRYQQSLPGFRGAIMRPGAVVVDGLRWTGDQTIGRAWRAGTSRLSDSSRALISHALERAGVKAPTTAEAAERVFLKSADGKTTTSLPAGQADEIAELKTKGYVQVDANGKPVPTTNKVPVKKDGVLRTATTIIEESARSVGEGSQTIARQMGKATTEVVGKATEATSKTYQAAKTSQSWQSMAKNARWSMNAAKLATFSKAGQLTMVGAGLTVGSIAWCRYETDRFLNEMEKAGKLAFKDRPEVMQDYLQLIKEYRGPLMRNATNPLFFAGLMESRVIDDDLAQAFQKFATMHKLSPAEHSTFNLASWCAEKSPYLQMGDELHAKYQEHQKAGTLDKLPQGIQTAAKVYDTAMEGLNERLVSARKELSHVMRTVPFPGSRPPSLYPIPAYLSASNSGYAEAMERYKASLQLQKEYLENQKLPYDKRMEMRDTAQEKYRQITKEINEKKAQAKSDHTTAIVGLLQDPKTAQETADLLSLDLRRRHMEVAAELMTGEPIKEYYKASAAYKQAKKDQGWIDWASGEKIPEKLKYNKATAAAFVAVMTDGKVGGEIRVRSVFETGNELYQKVLAITPAPQDLPADAPAHIKKLAELTAKLDAEHAKTEALMTEWTGSANRDFKEEIAHQQAMTSQRGEERLAEAKLKRFYEKQIAGGSYDGKLLTPKLEETMAYLEEKMASIEATRQAASQASTIQAKPMVQSKIAAVVSGSISKEELQHMRQQPVKPGTTHTKIAGISVKVVDPEAENMSRIPAKGGSALQFKSPSSLVLQ